MKQLFCYVVIFFTTFNAERAARVYQMIYHPNIKQPEKKEEKKIELPVPVKKKDDKDDLRETLEYLRNKKNKSEAEKNSLSFLEGMNL
jgi:uncharacterized membrane protein